MKESPIFILAFETLTWILEHTRKWPKDQRFVLARRIEEAAFDFQDHLVYAAKATSPLPYLQQADAHLTRLRLYNRLALKLKLFAFGQYEYLARALDELGRLLGGWLRAKKGAPDGVRQGSGD